MRKEEFRDDNDQSHRSETVIKTGGVKRMPDKSWHGWPSDDMFKNTKRFRWVRNDEPKEDHKHAVFDYKNLFVVIKLCWDVILNGRFEPGNVTARSFHSDEEPAGK